MNTDELSRDLKSVDTLVKDGIVSKERGEILKEKMIAKFEGAELSEPAPKDMPSDLVHFPGRLVAGIFKALGNINPDRCAGMAPEQVAARKQSRSSDPQDLVDNLPSQYK